MLFQFFFLAQKCSCYRYWVTPRFIFWRLVQGNIKTLARCFKAHSSKALHNYFASKLISGLLYCRCSIFFRFSFSLFFVNRPVQFILATPWDTTKITALQLSLINLLQSLRYRIKKVYVSSLIPIYGLSRTTTPPLHRYLNTTTSQCATAVKTSVVQVNFPILTYPPPGTPTPLSNWCLLQLYPRGIVLQIPPPPPPLPPPW